jgi:hypothetical protein
LQFALSPDSDNMEQSATAVMSGTAPRLDYSRKLPAMGKAAIGEDVVESKDDGPCGKEQEGGDRGLPGGSAQLLGVDAEFFAR